MQNLRNRIALSILLCSGCSFDANALHGVGIVQHVDGGLGVDAEKGIDTQTGSDARVEVDLGVAVDTRPDTIPDVGGIDTTASILDAVVDTKSDAGTAISCDKIGPWAGQTSLRITLPTSAYCFKLCFATPEPISALDYAWACTGFADTDRTIAVNGQRVACGSRPLPTEVDGVWTFVLSAGGHANDFINWTGVLRACP